MAATQCCGLRFGRVTVISKRLFSRFGSGWSDKRGSSTAVADKSVTILYGSQTGNAKGIAEQYYNKLKADGLSAKLLNMVDYKPKNIKNESHVVIVVSTHGEGDAPDDAVTMNF